MARKRRNQTIFEQAGFYIVDNQGRVRTRTVNRGKGEARVQVEEPIRARTISGAKDLLCAFGEETHAILYVTVNNFAWTG